MDAKVKKRLIEEYGSEAFEFARIMVDLTDADGAWAEAMDQGMEDVAEIIEELYMGEDDGDV